MKRQCSPVSTIPQTLHPNRRQHDYWAKQNTQFIPQRHFWVGLALQAEAQLIKGVAPGIPNHDHADVGQDRSDFVVYVFFYQLSVCGCTFDSS